MTTYASALAAARDAAASQHYPQAALYLVATPIGNLADISLRALHVLQLADTIACEDTRHTQALLRAYGIDKPGAQLLALHQHNEAEAAQQVVQRLRQGQRVAYVSDAGTPAISDPGARLVAVLAGRAAGYPDSRPQQRHRGAERGRAGRGRWRYLRVCRLPASRAGARHGSTALASEPRAIVLLEAPHRIDALACAWPLGPRKLTVARELTKQFEQVVTLSAAEFAAWLAPTPTAPGASSCWCCIRVVAADTGDDLRVLQCCWIQSCHSRPRCGSRSRSPARRATAVRRCAGAASTTGRHVFGLTGASCASGIRTGREDNRPMHWN
jgi:16S rRNA (cytidine1402-2'-O)-methyltransferase